MTTSSQPQVPEIRLYEVRATKFNRIYRIRCQIVGKSKAKAIPASYGVQCLNCNRSHAINLINQHSELNHRRAGDVLFGSKKVLKERLTDAFKEHYPDCISGMQHSLRYFESDNVIDYRILYARDLPLESDRFEQRVYEIMSIHLLGEDETTNLKVMIEGSPMIDGDKNIVVVSGKIYPLEDDLINFKITEEDKENFELYFKDKPLDYLADEIAPHIVGEKRRFSKVINNLQLHSVYKIPDVNGDIIRGTICVCSFGDTTTGKSEIGKDITFEKFGLGDFVMGESSGRTGLTYSIDSDRNTIIWGSMPLNDRGLVIVDGAQDMPHEEFDKMVEAIRLQMVSVRRSVRGDALARTSIMMTLNPRRGKVMKDYIYPCMALRDTNIFRSEKNIARFDVFVPFRDDDVSNDQLAHAEQGIRPIPEDIFTRHVYWARSKEPEDVIYTDEAKEAIKKCAEIFLTYKDSKIPLVHSGIRGVLCRLSVAVAAHKHSTDENHEKVIVKVKHVKEAVEVYRNSLKITGFFDYHNDMQIQNEVTYNEFILFIGSLDDKDFQILDLLAIAPQTASSLSKVIGISEVNVRGTHFGRLKKADLIETKSHAGAELTEKGIKFVEAMKKMRDNLGLT